MSINAQTLDTRLGFTDCTVETYPFMLNGFPSSPIYTRYMQFDMQNYIFNERDIVHRSLYYDNGSTMYFNDPAAGIMFCDINEREGLNYGLALVNNMFSNNIFASMNLYDRETIVNGYSFFNIPVTGGYTHYNAVYGSWKFIAGDAFLSNAESGFRAGIATEIIDFRAGITTAGRIPAVIRANPGPVDIFGYAVYDPSTKALEKNINAALPLRMGRFTLMPLINYSDTLNIFMGALYRITQYASAYANAGYDFENIKGNMGIRIFKQNNYLNVQAGIDDSMNVSCAASAMLSGGPVNFFINAEYEDSVSYDAGLMLSGTFLNGHFSPGLLLSYSDDIAFTGIKARILDADIFFGSYWDIADTTYTLTGGFEWYFFEERELQPSLHL